MRQDDVLLSSKAWDAFGSGSVSVALKDLPTNSGLVAAARNVHEFLDEHPRVADSAFGKAAKFLVRGTAHLEKAGDIDSLPEDSKAQLLRAARKAAGFLSDHPRVAESPFGKSVARLAEGIVRAIGAEGGDTGAKLSDWLIEAAKRADLHLDEYPTLASMPLGQVVKKLVDGVKAMADGNPLDAHLQTLAKRVGHFLQSNPRLAQSEFGQVMAPLVRGFVAVDVSARFPAELPAGGTVTQAKEVAVVAGVIAGRSAPIADGDAAGETRRAA